MKTLLLLSVLGLLALGLAPLPATADGEDVPADPGPEVVIHVPTDEMDVLLQADRRGVVLHHAAYLELLAEARANARATAARPPADGTLTSAEGVLDLTGEDAARFDVTYRAVVLAKRPSLVPFPLQSIALSELTIEGEGRYEELGGEGRLRFVGPGERTIRVVGYATPLSAAGGKLLKVRLPPASAMALETKLPPAIQGEMQGEGEVVRLNTPPEAGETTRLRPARDGTLAIAWGPASRSTDGPAVLDVRTEVLHTIEDRLIRSRLVVHVDVLRAPIEKLELELPPELALRAAGGKGVAGTSRSDDRTRLGVDLVGPKRGRLTLTLDGETPFEPGPDLRLPGVVVADAVRQRGRVSVQFGPEVLVHDIRVEGGRRLPSTRRKGGSTIFRYGLARADGAVRVDIEPGSVRLEAASTYYVNLTEPAQTLIAAVTYRVVQGTAFRLLPRFPSGFPLRTLLVNGRTDGFRLDERPDGTVEVRLDQGAREGSEVTLLATLERAQVDWVPDDGSVRVPFAVPSAGAAHEDAFVGIGADASFRVLDADVKDLVAVGAAELTTRGVSAAGLVYGYRLDGAAPSVVLDVERRSPRLEATVVARAVPTPRRLAVWNVVVHTIERAGVRRLLVDVPEWAGDEVRIDAPDKVAASRLEEQPADVAAGYDRWEVVLGGRVLGRHALAVRYHEDQEEDDWSVPADRALAVRVPLDGVERSVVVTRAAGLEVDLSGDAPAQDLAELPAEAGVDPLTVREVVRLENGMDGPGIAVSKHDGAPVLDAIAPRVMLDTAVAREGILRTRATITLVNVGLQYLRVSLPPDSELVGATVDDQSVKPLADDRGLLHVPIPPARQRGAATVATLTYETRLGRDAIGHVAIPGPEFPGLEVLKTTHSVAFDPGFEIRDVEGDYGSTGGAGPDVREPWLLKVASVLPMPMAGADSAMVTVEAEEPAQQMEVWVTDEAMPYEESLGAPAQAVQRSDSEYARRQQVLEAGLVALQGHISSNETTADVNTDRPPALEVGPDFLVVQQEDLFKNARVDQDVEALRRNLDQLRTEANRLPQAQQELQSPSFSPPRATLRRSQTRGGGEPRYMGPPPGTVPPGLRDPTDPPPPPGVPPVTSPPVARPAPDVPADPALPPDSQGIRAPGLGGPPAGQPRGPTAGGEGPGPVTPTPTPSRVKRRKGLLSLDVPVLLSNNVVQGERLGSGGAMVVSVAPTVSDDARYAWLGLLSFAAGLAFAVRRRWLAVFTPLALVGLGVLVLLVFGRESSTVSAALIDAATALAVVLGLRWLVHRLVLRRGAAVAAVLCLFVLGSATSAFADDETDEEHGVETPRRVYVPYDPADPAVPRADDRVFLPFDTYLHLRKLAHPEEDPEVLEKGRVVAVVGASHALRVGSEEAEGRMTLTYVKRGEGVHFEAIPLGGLAVTKAVLDGRAVRLLMKDGGYHVPLVEEGDHVLEVQYRAPVEQDRQGRSVVLDVPRFAAASLQLEIEDFEGEVLVDGAGRVGTVEREGTLARTLVHLGALSRVGIVLRHPVGSEPEVALRTRVQSHVVHSIRDGGTRSQAHVTLHVLQGKADHVDLDLPVGVSVLRVGGKHVARWDASDGRLRLEFAAPVEGAITFDVDVVRATATPEREETLPALAVRDTTGERGTIVVNADPALRVGPLETAGLLRTATPRDKASRGPDKTGRVTGAWHYAARPTSFRVAVTEAETGLTLETVQTVVFGDDHVRTRFDAVVKVDERVPVGELVFDLPGDDHVRTVTSGGLDTWWTEGEGDERTLHLRYVQVRKGLLGVVLHLERRLGGQRDGVAVPRWALRGAQRDLGRLVLFGLPDVDPDAGRLPGLRSVPVTGDGVAPLTAPPAEGARPVRAFRWEAPVAASLPVTLRTPPLDVEAVVVSSVDPGADAHRLDHLVLFDVRLGATERFDVFVPDGGFAALDVVRTRNQREVRSRRVKRRGPDDKGVEGTLYEVRTQAPQGGLVEVTVSQVVAVDRPIRVVRPERVQGEDQADREIDAVRYFSLVRAFLDGEVDTTTEAEGTEWEDLPFTPTGLQPADVVKSVSASAPYVLAVTARRHRLELQADAVVRAVQADVVLGRDGEARVRSSYRLFNRRRQFLPVRLPEGSILFGVTVARRPVKTLQGEHGALLIPVPKVPLGGAGYTVSILYRAPAGQALPRSDLNIQLPEIEGVDIDRTLVRLYAPDGFEFDIESEMTETEQDDVAADLAEAAVREAKDLIKVAGSGTLEQRTLACDNAAILVAEANDLNIRSGNKRAALDRDVQQVTRDFKERYAACVTDLEAAGRAAAGQTLEFFAGNAASFLDMEDNAKVTASSAQQAGGARVERQTRSKWRYNPTRSDEKGKKQEFQQLKERLGKALEERSKQEVADVDVEVAQAASVANIVRRDGTKAEADVMWKNFARLNDALVADQNRNRQLGVVPQGQTQTYQFGYYQPSQAAQALANLDDVTNGLEDQRRAGFDNGAFPQPGAIGTSRDSGVFFTDAVDGTYQGRVENLFDVALGQTLPGTSQGAVGFGFTSFGDENGDGFFADTGVDLRAPGGGSGGGGGGYVGGQARTGLMGVDVALPKGGQVFHFRALRAGAPLEIEVATEGWSDLAKWALFLGVILVVWMVVRGAVRMTKGAAAKA